ncbi:hypothetical protein MKEN_01366200 [Mycena kentingensis (nom. inval.)]|nr:hypothetical protein MKEN_01366200 [Mycena kentingensis (nom. inval.)]
MSGKQIASVATSETTRTVLLPPSDAYDNELIPFLGNKRIHPMTGQVYDVDEDGNAVEQKESRYIMGPQNCWVCPTCVAEDGRARPLGAPGCVKCNPRQCARDGCIAPGSIHGLIDLSNCRHTPPCSKGIVYYCDGCIKMVRRVHAVVIKCPCGKQVDMRASMVRGWAAPESMYPATAIMLKSTTKMDGTTIG